MQFGRITGIGLMVLGILLCGFQFVLYMAPAKNPGTPAARTSPPEQGMTEPEHKTSFLPGIIGAAAVVAGIAVFATARRRDEPEPQHAVK